MPMEHVMIGMGELMAKWKRVVGQTKTGAGDKNTHFVSTNERYCRERSGFSISL